VGVYGNADFTRAVVALVGWGENQPEDALEQTMIWRHNWVASWMLGHPAWRRVNLSMESQHVG
jgi:hypothetical protein